MPRVLKHADRNNLVFGLLLGLLAAAGVFLLFYITPFGMGLVNDSVGYIGGARNILAGNGYSRLTGNYKTVPITNYPPMFPITLAAFGLFGVDAVTASWILNIFLFGANILLMGLVVRKASGSVLFSLIGALLFGASAPIFLSHSFAMSEPLYLFFSFLMFILLASFFDTGKLWQLAGSGAIAGMAFLTRYVGAALFICALTCLLVFLPNWKKRIRSSLVFLAAGLPFVTAWLVRNTLVSNNPANRQLLFHPIPVDKIREGIINFWIWIFPENFILLRRPMSAGAGVFGLLCIGILTSILYSLVVYRRRKNENSNKSFSLGWGFSLFGLVYLAIVWASMTFVDASPIFEYRILSPFMVSLLFSGMVVFAWLWDRRKLWLQSGLLIACAVFMFLLTQNGRQWVLDLHIAGQGFASAEWTENETFDIIRQLPKVTLYSNKITAIYILTNRPAYILPSLTNPATGLPNENYQTYVNNVSKSALDGQAMVVVFDYDKLQENLDDRQWISDLTGGLPIYKTIEKDVIFGRIP